MAFVYNAGATVNASFKAINAFIRGDFWAGLAYIVIAVVHGTLAILNAFGIRASMIGPPPPMGPALAFAGGGSAAIWSGIVANKVFALWVIQHVAPVVFSGYLMMAKSTGGGGKSGDSSGSGGNSEDHHKVPYGNKTFDHQNHPLVKKAGVDLKEYPENRMILENHSGRHSNAYHIEVKGMLDQALENMSGQGKGAALEAFNEVCDEIEIRIANGSLKPYISKDVFYSP
jgi:hypothetical protein